MTPLPDLAIADSAVPGHADASAAAHPVLPRLQLDQVDGLVVRGWAVAAGGAVAALRLVADGEEVEASFERTARQDVLDALGLAGDMALGFQVRLPAAIWSSPAGAIRSVEVRSAAGAVAVPLPLSLEVMAGQVRQMPVSVPGFDERLTDLAQHVRSVGSDALAIETADWLEQMLQARGKTGADASLGPRVRGRVEQVDLAVVRGWAWDGLRSAESIELRCAGEVVDCSVIRVERNDVQAALGTDRRHLGFEIEIPATVWEGAALADRRLLSVSVAGRPLQAEPVEITPGHVLDWLAELARRGQPSPDEPPAVRQEWQYSLLLLLEHVAAAGLLPRLSGEQAALVRTNAALFGLQALLEGGEGKAPSAGQGFASGMGAGPDLATQMNWRLVRAFNHAVHQDPAQPLPALEQLLRTHQPRGQIRERFLWSVLPFFCSRSLYASIRHHLDGARLRALASSNSAYELSLMLPELVHSGDFGLAGAGMARLSEASDGWLNTECIHEAVRSAASVGDPRHPDVVGFLDAYLAFLERMGELGYWSRLHDAHLMGGLLSMLERGPALTTGQVGWASDLAVRRYGLVPDFWRLWERARAPLGGWSPRLEAAHEDFLVVSDLLDHLDKAGAELRREGFMAIARFRAAGNPDAETMAREVVMSCAPFQPGAGDATATSLTEAACTLIHARRDRLRLAAHPAAWRLVPGGAAELAQEIRELSGIPPQARRQALTRLVPLCLDARSPADAFAALEERALHWVAGVDNHHVGVRLMASAWKRLYAGAVTAEAETMLAELAELWFSALKACAEAAHPPAALTTSFSELASLAAPAGSALGQLVDEMRRGLESHFGETAPYEQQGHATSGIEPGAGAYSTLVAIYSCERNLPTRVQAIRDSWAKDLTARGIPWVVVVGGGEGRLDGDVLRLAAPDDYESLPAKTMALVDWVYRHTSFEHLIKIDDDCHLAVDAYFDEAPFLSHHYHGRLLHRAIGATDRIWHQGKSRSRRAAVTADKTPEPSTYADGSSAYALSRYAMAQVALALESTVGARLTRSAFLEDKLLGDLLATRGLAVSNEGHYTLIRRRFGPAALPVNAWDNLFYPGQSSPTLVTHLDDHLPMAAVQARMGDTALRPPRLWPTDRPVQVSGHQTNQLELLSDPARLALLDDAPFLVVAVARNEKVLLPHFLAHYRALGATAFVLVDNLSDDGTREYLHAQPDVILYSADTEYKESHFGVSWQQAVLGAHAVGRWVVLADIDEFLVYPGSEQRPLVDWLVGLEADGHDAARVLMVDMYPAGPLHEADFEQHAPFALATCYDRQPLLPWRLGSGSFSNSPTWLSALRHRLIPDSAPNIYTSQKLAVVKYRPWIRFAEGLHYASNLCVAPDPVWFAHFKYHAGFQRKVQTEVARKQHFNGAEEYRKYAGMLAEARDSLAAPGVTATYAGSRSWAPVDE